jgi:glycosyltransferase involved in cell wall biosynthesis
MAKTVSLCMIVKNEEKRLPRCLDSYKPLVDEIVVVDTGSSDGIVEISRSAGARIFTTAWENDFSKARNLSLDKASCDWILWTDADDFITPPNVEKIRRIKDVFPLRTAFSFMIKNSQDGLLGDVFNQVRMFPRHPKIRFRYKVHEQVLPAIQELGFATEYTDIMVVHTGYAGPEVIREKQLRNLTILEQEMKERPDNPVVVYSYAGTLLDLEEFDKAVPLYEKARQLSIDLKREPHIAEGVPISLASLFGRRKDWKSARQWAEEAYKINPSHAQTNSMLGEICEMEGKEEESIRYFEFVLTCREKPEFIPVDVNRLKVNAYKHLGMIYKKRGMDQKAVEYLKKALQVAGK